MIIERPALLLALDTFARTGHGLITGAPGVGKSHSVRALSTKWRAAGVPHRIVAVDDLGSATDAELRSALGVESDYVVHFAGAIGQQKGVLVFDGVDAARNEETRARVLALVRRFILESAERWTVVATVRTYDATRSQSLRDLFRDSSAPLPQKGRGLSETRHIEIPLLSDDEVAAAIPQIAGLEAILGRASADFRALLRVPFNLWLLRQILTPTQAAEGITSAASTTQLLGLYWERRVMSGDSPDAVHQLLHTAVTRMVTDNVLSVSRAALFASADRKAWTEVRSANVLIEQGTDGNRIAFAHNILFDYAVSVLLLDDDTRTLERFFADDPARPFFLRPSVLFLFTRLWYDDRAAFWKVSLAALASASQHLSLVGRIVPSAVIVNEARRIEDLEPLFERLEAGDDLSREYLLRVMQAVRALGNRNAQLWARFAAEATLRPHPRYLWDATTLVASMLEAAGPEAKPQITEYAGIAGRAALAWSLDQRKHQASAWVDNLGGYWGTRLTAETLATDPSTGSALLRRALALVSEPDFPIQYLSRLCDSIAAIAPVDPVLAGDVYRVVFAHEEVSDKKTDFGTPILPMTSTRKQDFGMCSYILLKEFDAFLAVAPTAAVEAALDAVSTKLLQDHVLRFAADQNAAAKPSVEFAFGGSSVSVINDGGALWLYSSHRDDEEKLLAKVIDRLTAEARAGNRSGASALVEAFPGHAMIAGMWGALIQAGADTPDALGARLAELAVVPHFQRALYHQVGKLIASSFQFWSRPAQAAVEASLERFLAAERAEAEDEVETRIPDLLIASIPAELAESPLLREEQMRIAGAGGAPNDRPPYQQSMSWGTYSNEDWLKDEGVDVDEPVNRSLIDAGESLKAMCERWQNGRIPAQQVTDLATELARSRQLLKAGASGARQEVLDSFNTRTTEAAGVLASADGELPEYVMTLARETLLEAARAGACGVDSQDEQRFMNPAWSPSPLTEAAQGLPWLALRTGDEQVVDAIEELTRSPVPAARYLTVAELFRIRWKMEARFWKIAEKVAEQEGSEVVLGALLMTLSRIPPTDSSRISTLLKVLHSRGLESRQRSSWTDTYAGTVAWLGLTLEDKWALTRLEQIAQHPLHAGALAEHITFDALGALAPERLKKPKEQAVAARSVELLRTMIARAGETLQGPLPSDLPLDATEVAYRIVDEVASRLYFHVRQPDAGDNDSAEVDAHAMREYFDLVKPIIEDCITFGTRPKTTLIAQTAHHLMELLRVLLPLDPRAVLHLAAGVAVAASERGSYHLDAMAVGEVVKIAEDVLADHRLEIANGQALADFVKLMDVFANAGWPEALRVLWRLDEVFR